MMPHQFADRSANEKSYSLLLIVVISRIYTRDIDSSCAKTQDLAS
jgi:hypothetical protein